MLAARRQREDSSYYTVEGVLTSLGYPDLLVAPREHARMILLGRQVRYQTITHQLEARWDCSLEALRARYLAYDSEDFAADDNYLQGQWYADDAWMMEAQLTTLAMA